MKELFPHNQQAYEAVMQHFNSGNKRAAVVHATGTGKSYIIGAVTSHYAKCLVIAPNNFVLDETRKVCHDCVEFRTYASVMYDEVPSTYDLIVLDEFHRSGAEKWGAGVQRLLDANADAFVLGTSATHIRYLDNQRNMADEIFDGNVVSYLPLKEAIDRNILPNPTYVSSIYTMDDTVRSYEKRIRSCRKKDVDKEDACRRLHGIASNWDNAGGVPTIIRKYFSHDMQRIIVFCSKVKRAAAARELLSKWFGMAGFNRVRYYNIDYKEKRLEKEMADFQAPIGDYDLKVAISVNMLNEGVHIPRVDGVIMLRSTISRIIIEQQVGRCLTSDNHGRTPVVLDLVNNMDLISYDENPFAGIDKNGDGSRADKEHSGNGFPFKVIDECRDMRVLLKQLDNHLNIYGYDEMRELTLQYDVLLEFRSDHPNEYDAIRRNSWNELTEHMERKLHLYTKEDCHEKALLCKSKGEFMKRFSAYYIKAYRQGWLDDICGHLIRRRIGVLDMCIKDAQKYELRSEWKKHSPEIYKMARARGYAARCCAHMKKESAHSFEECLESALKYNGRRDWFVGDGKLYGYAKSHGWIDKCCEHMEWKRCKTRTIEECKIDAAKYTSRSEWSVKANGTYCYAKSRGWLEECCKHMKLKKVTYSWTKEECIASARQFTYKSDWKFHDKAIVSYARRHGYYDECTAHMIQKRTKPRRK